MLYPQPQADRLTQWFSKKTGLLTSPTTTCHDTTRYVIVSSDPSLLVLASLADGDKHGYAMVTDIEAFAGIRLGPGTLYGAITRLEERGWIVPIRSSDRRQPYRLTAAGRRQLQEQLAGLERVVTAGLRRLKHT
jgi:DNA-binding PadR family transcriptional regulator